MGENSTIAHYYSPSANVSRGDNRLARTTEYASQIEALIAAGLDVVRELHNHDVGHHIAVLLLFFVCVWPIVDRSKRSEQHRMRPKAMVEARSKRKMERRKNPPWTMNGRKSGPSERRRERERERAIYSYMYVLLMKCW